MESAKEELPFVQIIDLVSAVNALHKLSSHELGKLLKESDDFTIQYVSEKESIQKVDGERLASCLPLHLVAVLMTSDRDEALFKYLLSGIRLLHSLCDLASRNPRLEQILLDDVKVSEQLLDLVFYILVVLSGYEQKSNNFRIAQLMHSALVACSLHLLTGCISSQWQDLVLVLLAHPKELCGKGGVLVQTYLMIQTFDHTLQYTLLKCSLQYFRSLMEIFLSGWCFSALTAKEEDGSIEYDSFAAVGWVLDVASFTYLHNAKSLEFSVIL